MERNKNSHMPSSLTWIDHDANARERAMRLLALFQEKETRDELGLGAVRDSFADQLFPGTSTIQTRLRYMLFIPWIHQILERQRIPIGAFAVQAERMERALVTPLMATEDQAGIFGKTSRDALKRLPSSVYWAGLGHWGIRLLSYSQDEYYRRIDQIYRRQDEQRRLEKEARNREDDVDGTPLPGALMWHPRLPDPPADFPVQASFALTAEEAEFLLDSLQRHHAESLLAFLARHCKPSDVTAPWQHPDWASFQPDHQVLLKHARIFSDVMHGAALLYNILLADLRKWTQKSDDYRMALHSWEESLDISAVRDWSLKLEQFWDLMLQSDHVITPPTHRFIERWVDLIVRNPKLVGNSVEAHDLIRQREMNLKRSNSRFTNHRALDQWGGASGINRLVYRWPTAQTLLSDLYAGLQRRPSAC